jgi:hypothetical protein
MPLLDFGLWKIMSLVVAGTGIILVQLTKGKMGYKEEN